MSKVKQFLQQNGTIIILGVTAFVMQGWCINFMMGKQYQQLQNQI